MEKHIDSAEMFYPTLCDDFGDEFDYADNVIMHAVREFMTTDEDIFEDERYDEWEERLVEMCKEKFGERLFEIYRTTCQDEEMMFESDDKKNRINVLVFKYLDGQNFKYLPIHKGSDEEHFPRIMPIAGVYPSITYEQLMAPRSSEASDPGQWAYEFTDPDGPQIGTVALPGSDTITNCIDPVVVISKNTDLGVTVIEEVEMIVVVDRGDI
jgi:hypothetical protein